MIEFRILIALMLLMVLAKSWSDEVIYTIKDVQGGWWSNCDDPSVEFYIDGNQYGGDFIGTYNVEVKNGVLTFKEGLISGYSLNVTGIPLSFNIMHADNSKLVLEPIRREGADEKWHVFACG